MKQSKLIPLLGLGFTLFLSKTHMIYGNTSFGGGSGTESDPYRLSTPEHLTELQIAVDGGNSFSGKYFILTQDIDFTGYDNDDNPNNGNFDPIGYTRYIYDNEAFSGNLDGRNHTILNVKIIMPDVWFTGLFSYLENAEIQNLNLENVYVEGESCVGGLVGNTLNSVVKNIFVSGEVSGVEGWSGLLVGQSIEGSQFNNVQGSGVISGGDFIGGLIGYLEDSELKYSSFSGEVEGVENVGGLAGSVYDGLIHNSSVISDVKGEYSVGGVFGVIWDSIAKQIYNRGTTVGESFVGGFAGYVESSIINQSFASGDVIGTFDVGGFAGQANNTELTNSYSTGEVTGDYYVGGLVGLASQPLKISNSYSTGEVTGDYYVGGLTGLIDDYYGSDEAAIIQDSYYDGVINGTASTGAIVGFLGYYDDYDDVRYDGSVSFNNIYYNQEKNPAYSMVGDTTHGTIVKANAIPLTTIQMTQGNAKNYMSALDFENIWVMTSTTPMFQWQNNLAPAHSGQVQVKGTVETMVADITIPSVSPDLVINPNLPEGYVSPEFSISNDSVSPIRLELKTFEQTTGTFNDVLPTKYDSWVGLNKRQSEDLALGLIAKEGEGWQSLTNPTSYVVNHTDHEIGIIKPNSSVDFSFDVKHGTSFSEAKTVQYKMVFVFDLMS